MKGLILSGGAGTRLRPITHTSAKQLVPVANKPILFYGIEDMAEAGITDIGIIVGDTQAEIMTAVGDGSDWGVQVTYIAQDAPLGLAHCVRIAHDFLGDDDFVMYLGDNMLQQGLVEFIDHFHDDRRSSAEPTLAGAHAPPSAQILLCHVPDPHRFGVAEIDAHGHVVRLVEKPEQPPSDLALVGVYLFTAAIHEAVAAIQPSERGELEITDAIQWLIDHGHRVRHEIVEGWWLDTGKKDPLLESNRRVLDTIEPRMDGTMDDESQIDGRVVIEAGAELVKSSVRGPAIIGAGTRLVNSYVGPFTAIANDCEIIDSEIEQSVVLEHSHVLGVPRLSDSLIGKYVEVRRSTQRPRATRLMVGDHCSIDLE
jgi:glucose-1-phosphate thymidylyltransferase